MKRKMGLRRNSVADQLTSTTSAANDDVAPAQENGILRARCRNCARVSFSFLLRDPDELQIGYITV
jgi:hypothetical protein